VRFAHARHKSISLARQRGDIAILAALLAEGPPVSRKTIWVRLFSSTTTSGHRARKQGVFFERLVGLYGAKVDPAILMRVVWGDIGSIISFAVTAGVSHSDCGAARRFTND